jgi:hypothetical protein
MKIRLLITIAGLAINFVLPTFAQQIAMVPDRQVIQQLVALGQKYHEAYANNDAAALAVLYTWDATIVNRKDRSTVGTPYRIGMQTSSNSMAPQKLCRQGR